MPVIARFYGIVIKMYFKEHGASHFHALYNEFNGVFNVKTLEMIEGDLPTKAKQLVLEWAKKISKRIKKNVENPEIHQTPGVRIKLCILIQE